MFKSKSYQKKFSIEKKGYIYLNKIALILLQMSSASGF